AGLADANIFGNRFVGALVGYAAGTEIRHMHVTGDVMGYDHVGGLVGIAGGSIHDSYAMGTVTGVQPVGGLVWASGGEILRSFASAEVRGGSGAPTDESIGGLVGYQFSGSIGQSYAVGTVSDAYQYVGGLVGYQAGGSISQSYAMGSVSGNNNLGGLVGWQNFGSISDRYWNTETTSQVSAV